MEASTSKTLFEISILAKYTPKEAATEILIFVKQTFPQINAVKIKINQSKVSLNSVNGFIVTADGKEYFFKFHTEEGEEVSLQKNEYYQAEELEKAGLPMISPIYESTEPGSQFLIYEKITALTAFDEFEKEENRYKETGEYDETHKTELLKAESKITAQQTRVYLATLKLIQSEKNEDAALYQLFLNRLVGRHGGEPRLDIFYTNQDVKLPEETLNFNELAKLRWVINGVEFPESLEDIIEKAKKLLNPNKNEQIPVVLGHGDCHNGNKFFIDGQFKFFDPAFAGWQPALLSFIKSTAHNTFLHPFWLYDPKSIEDDLEIHYEIKDGKIIVDHNWDLEDNAPIRTEVLKLQIENVWKPLIKTLKEKGWLPDDWQEYIRKALFCCPFLVYNLIDPSKYPPAQSLLALSKCVELGSKGDKLNLLEYFIEQITPKE